MEKDGTLIEERRRDHSYDRAILDEFAWRYAGSSVIIEAKNHYHLIYETLDEYVDATLVYPSKIRIIAKAKIKTARADAKMLAYFFAPTWSSKATSRRERCANDSLSFTPAKRSSRIAPTRKTGQGPAQTHRPQLPLETLRPNGSGVPRPSQALAVEHSVLEAM